VATDVGRQRSSNEDRAHADESNGIFLVVDGMGGHAAGEKAAQAAVDIIPKELERSRGELEPTIRNAITKANNEIFNMARARPEWAGMACVLTLAVAHGDTLTVGHVGDSRLYLAYTGRLRKLTSDHSPVGEREDRGDLTEEEAMRDPRRNVVFRDVGSRPHEAADEEFIETRSYPFRADAAFLLCTDGLSDVLTSAEMNAIVQRYDGDPQRVAEELVDAANEAGGKDNISVVFVAGAEFIGTEVRPLAEARSRHSITRMRRGGWWKRAWGALVWLLIGIVLGAAGWTQVEKFLPAPSAAAPAVVNEPPSIVRVNAGDPRALQTALASARPGATIEVPKGVFSGPIELREGVSVLSVAPGESVIRLDPAAAGSAPATAAVVARNINGARLSGFQIEGGMLIQGASLDADDNEVTGASDCGVRIEGGSKGTLRANFIHGNGGCGVLIEGGASPRLIGNRISKNGKSARPARAGVEIHVPAMPVLVNNVFEGSGPAIAGDVPQQTLTNMLRANLLIASGQGASR